MKFWKKKKPFSKLELGVDVKRCAECPSYTRPCLADDKPATFHRWVNEEEGILQPDILIRPDRLDQIVCRFRQEGLIPSGFRIEKLQQTFALVEYRDGSVGKIKPELIQFLDHVDQC